MQQVQRAGMLHSPAQQQLFHSPIRSTFSCSRSNRSSSSSRSRSRHRCCPQASAWGTPEPFAAAPSLASIADMQRQIDRDMDSMLMQSPFSTMRRMEERMEQQFREMDRQFDRAFADMDRAQAQLDAELARSMRQLQQQEPGVRIERREERAPGAYRYYESIQIRSGTPMTALTPAHSPAFFNPLLFVALAVAGAYAAVTAAFNRNYELTTYRQQGKWQLLLLWPLLLPFSKAFRSQFVSALKGEKVKVLDSSDEQSSS